MSGAYSCVRFDAIGRIFSNPKFSITGEPGRIKIHMNVNKILVKFLEMPLKIRGNLKGIVNGIWFKDVGLSGKIARHGKRHIIDLQIGHLPNTISKS